jgi:hypothetical protein
MLAPNSPLAATATAPIINNNNNNNLYQMNNGMDRNYE